MVEHSAVNRDVVGSSPTRGAKGVWCANWFTNPTFYFRPQFFILPITRIFSSITPSVSPLLNERMK